MSVSVTIKTQNIPEPRIILNRLLDEGEDIVVTSDSYPSVHLGNYEGAIRGIEINKEEEGVEVRICSLASLDDYYLYRKTIQVISQLTQGTIVDEEDNVITDVKEYVDEDWISLQRLSGLQIVKAFVRNTGTIITIFGLFTPMCIGPKLLKELEIPLAGDSELGDIMALEDYLCDTQWHLADLIPANTVDFPNQKDPSAKPLVMASIAIKEGKVCDFDYLPEADLLSIIDLDGSCNTGGCPSLIPMREAWKILPPDIFRPIDDEQYEKIGDLTLDIVLKMKKAARRYQPQRFHWKPPFPGHGLDEGQDTYILMWNPDISSVSLEDHNATIPVMLTEYFNWSIWEHERAGIGDHFFLVRCGEGNTGVVMSGVFDSIPYQDEDWSGHGRETYYIDMIPNLILNPETAPMITTEQLQKAIPSFDWTGGHSGRLLSLDEAKTLESLWANYIGKNTNQVDGVNMNYIDRDKL